MSPIRPVTTYLISLFLPLIMVAQHPLQYTRLSAEDGISSNSVQCILQDKDGIMWIGTNVGLNRYDGSSFIQYSLISQPALSNSAITALLQDDKGYIWIGTENGLNILDPQTNKVKQFVHHPELPSSLPTGIIRMIQKMKNGSVWIIFDKSIVCFSGDNIFVPVTIDPELLQKNMVLAGLTEMGTNEVWISYLDQVSVLAIKSEQHDHTEYISNALVYAGDYAKMFTDNDQNTWSISCYGVNRFDKHTKRFNPWIKNNYAVTGPNLHLHTCYCSDANGSIWLGNDRSGLVKYDLQQKKVIDYSWLVTQTNATIVYCIYNDNNNNIWIGTDNGIIKVSNRAAIFSNIPFTLQGKELKNIRCRRIMTDRNKVMYAATENYGLLKKIGDSTIGLSTFGGIDVYTAAKNNGRIKVPLNGKYDIGYIYDMWYDGNNVIWLAGYGISRLDTRSDSIELFLQNGDEKARFESINQFSICFAGKKFYSSGEHNMFTFDTVTRRLEPFTDNKGQMPFENLPAWSLVKKGDWIWAGTGKGLYKINALTNEVVKESSHPELGYGINDISVDEDGSCWISTAGGGIIHYNEGTGYIRQYTNRDGLSNNTVCGLLRDENDNLWISTYAGLSYFNRKTALFTNFYAKDGLNTDEFNRKALYKMPDGQMIFGGQNGYILFNPANAFKRNTPVNIMLTRFSKTNREGETTESIYDLSKLKEVTINPGDEFFSFHFTLSDMYDPAGNMYSYQLKGLDDAWHSLGSQHFVSFNRLPPGTYTLRIKGIVGKGSASANEIAVGILVKNVFYKTGWFITLAILAAIAVIYLVVRYRINQVKKIQYLRTSIASDLHDDVGSSLVRITILADAIKRDAVKEQASEHLATIAGISRGAVSTMKDVIWSIDARNDTMGGMINYMQDHLHNMLIPANIDFELSHAGLQDSEKLHMNFRQNVYLTFKEAINNVVKHSGASRVDIVLRKEHNEFIMMVKDNGKGFAARQGAGQGLHNMQLRADRLKAALEIISGGGVTILLKVPL